MTLYMGIVVYAPALALEALTGINQVLAILSIGKSLENRGEKSLFFCKIASLLDQNITHVTKQFFVQSGLQIDEFSLAALG